jgi:hypothetical protein
MSSENWRTRWVTDKCNIALALESGQVGAGYSEAAILVCATLNALAAEVWPDRGLDRVRFVELLIKMTPSSPSPATISVPLLVQHLRTESLTAEANTLVRALMPFGSSLVITGSDVDKSEFELLSICPAIPVGLLRKNSYACLLYEDVRSSYAHEYRPGGRADSWPMTMLQGQCVSYVNKVTERRVHFHIEWLARIAVELAECIDALDATLPLVRPATWWIDGAQ